MTKFNLLRNVIKRIGMHAILTTVKTKGVAYDVIIVDEGSIHIAQNIFAHSKASPNQHEIEAFASIIPKPDLIIWVTAPDKQSIDCILNRGHKRVKKSYQMAKAFVSHSSSVYNTLFSSQILQDGMICVDNDLSRSSEISLHDIALSISDTVESLFKN